MHARLTLAIVTVAFLGRVSACNAFSEMFCTGDTCLKRTIAGFPKLSQPRQSKDGAGRFQLCCKIKKKAADVSAVVH